MRSEWAHWLGGLGHSCPSLTSVSSIEQRLDPEAPSGLFGCAMALGSERGEACLQRFGSSRSFKLHSGFHTLVGQP